MSRGWSFFKHISSSIVSGYEGDSHDSDAVSWRRRRPSLGICSPSGSSGKRFPRPGLGSYSPNVSSGKRFSKVLAKARRMMTPAASISPMAASCSPCSGRRLGEFPCSPSTWFTSRKSPKKSPSKYRRRSSLEIDREFDQLLCSQEVGEDDIPGCVSQNDGFFSSCFSDFSASDNSTTATTRGSSLALDVSIPRTAKKIILHEPGLSLEEALARDEEDSVRLSKIINSSIAQLELHDSLSNPASFARNRNRLSDKLRKLEALRQHLADPTHLLNEYEHV